MDDVFGLKVFYNYYTGQEEEEEEEEEEEVASDPCHYYGNSQ
jgi:hypothetical protein